MASQKIAEQILEAHLCRVNYNNHCILNFNLQFCSKSVLGGGGVGDCAKAPLRLGGPYLTSGQHFDSEDDYCTGCRNVSHCQQQPYLGLRSPAGHNHAPPTYEMTPGFNPLTVFNYS